MHKKWIPAVLLAVSVASYAEQGEQIKFAIIGDYGDNTKGELKVSKLISKRNPDFVITLGDNNYKDGCWDTIDKNIGKYYSSFIGNYKGEYGSGSKENRFFPSIGNHDWNALDKCLYKGGLPYLSYFTLPNNGLYYDFKKGSVHFFVVDSDPHEPDGNKQGSRQYEWLKTKLKESNACFKVVYFHHAAYSSGAHGSNKDMQWDFDKLGADIVLSGHDHVYERIKRDGITYYVNGVGGADLYKFEKKVDGSVYQYARTNGYMMGYADANHLKLAFHNIKDKEKDSVTYTKNCG